MGSGKTLPGSHVAVEVVPVLDPQEKVVFDGMVTQLRAGDPRLAQRLDRMCRPRRRLRTTIAILLWTLAPLCIVFGGWTGLIMAVVAVGYGCAIYFRRGLGAGETTSSSRRRPGVSN
jgi:DUF3040 family protein